MTFKTQYSVHDDFDLSVSLGLISGMKRKRIFAFRENVNSSGGISDLVNFGPDLYPFPSDTGEQVVLHSNSSSDTGILYQLEGLDAVGKEQIIQVATHATDATLPVTVETSPGVPALFSRINFFTNISAISSLADVHIKNTGLTNIYAQASIVAQRYNGGIYTNPIDTFVTVRSLIPSIEGNSGVFTNGTTGFGGFFRVKGGVFLAGLALGLNVTGTTSIAIGNIFSETFPGMTDIRFTGRAQEVNFTMAMEMTFILTDMGIV